MIKDHLDDILKCTRCGRCRALCPVNEELGWESTNARGRMLLARALAEDVKPSEAMKTSFYTCLTCAMCSATCPSGAQPDEVVEAARQELARSGAVPPYYKTVEESIEKYGNPLTDPGSRSAWAPPGSKGKSDLVYFAGCLMSYRKQAEAKVAFSLLSRFGARLLDDEQCCGSPLLRLGGKPATIEHNTGQIKRSGAKTVVTSCAGCYKTLKEDYNLEGVEVLHITQFLARHIPSLGLKKLPLKLTYHDPCHLGRCMKVYEEPREIIRRVGSFTEMASSKQDARCCGGGGGVRRGYKELAQKIAVKRLKDVPAGTDYVVTACPMCNSNLEDAAAFSGAKAKVRVIDICDLILLSAGDTKG